MSEGWTHQQAVDAALHLIDGYFRNEGWDRRANMTIPARPDNDDLLLLDYLDQVKLRAEKAEALNAKLLAALGEADTSLRDVRKYAGDREAFQAARGYPPSQEAAALGRALDALQERNRALIAEAEAMGTKEATG